MSETLENQEAILRTCSYHRSLYYFPLRQTNPRKAPDTLFKCSPTTSSSLVPQTANNTASIYKLPPEVISNILLLVDVKSFHDFRNTSHQARFIANGIPQYRLVAQHGFAGIKALVQTHLSRHVTYDNLYRALNTEQCTMCGEFGSLLFLPTCTRCCYNCLREKPELAVINYYDVYHLRRVLANRMGEDIPSQTDCRTLTIHNWENPVEMSRYTIGILATDIPRRILSLAHTEGNRNATVQKGWLHYRSAACIAYPTLNRWKMTVERGVSCKGCEKAFVSGRFGAMHQGWATSGMPRKCVERDMSFSVAGFQRHFESCEHAKKIWEDSEHGSKDTNDSKTVKNGGQLIGRSAMRAYAGIKSRS
uniref:WGS project CBMF000000000 data, contig CS5834_c000465 n=1 Tax=Fusarium pseudograminearum CS5834 TaxID=1318459 RepID=A0A096PE63_FUSPS|nr:unnamed protein product [Fusarium pseudograminearum CS5834]